MAEAKEIYNLNNQSAPPFYQPPFIRGKNFWISYSESLGNFGAHWHGELEIFYLLPGAGRHVIMIDGKEYILEAGDAAFIFGTEVHSFRTLDDRGGKIIIEMGFSLLGDDYVLFAGKRMENAVVHVDKDAENSPGATRLKAIFDGIYQEVKLLDKNVDNWSHVNRLKMKAWLFALSGAMAEYLPLAPVSAQRARQLEAVMAVQNVLNYVEQAYPEPITLEYAASISGYEKTRFCQLFKQAVGMPFHKYLNDRRIRAAASLLQGTNLPISRISETVGIPQHKTFCRLVRDTYGMTPSELRAGAGSGISRENGKPDVPDNNDK